MYDLIVCGGGFTGVAAAVAAAREGLKVLILEKSGFLGGAAGNCYINPFMPYQIQREGKAFTINRGLFQEILRRLEKIGGLHQNKCTFGEEHLKLILDAMTREYGIDVLFHTLLLNVQQEEGLLKKVQIMTKKGSMDFSARYFIDATGDGDLCVRAGCDFHVGREADGLCQPMTLCFRLSNVDKDKMRSFGDSAMQAAYKKAQEEGRISNPREDILRFDHMDNNVVHFNTTRIIKHDPLDVFDVSRAEMTARAQMYELYCFLKEEIPGFENSVLLSSAPEIGVRESRRIVGDYEITTEDILKCRQFEDSVCAGAYEIDIHNPGGTGTTHMRLPAGAYYTIPYRALIPKGRDNLLVAGRCISSNHEAQASYRIMPICCCMGEAAGMAVSQAAKKDCTTRQISMARLHEAMEQHGLLY